MIAGTPAIALTIAGSDPSGGAGIQADLKTFAALGVYGASVVTALTAQNTGGVCGVHGVPGAFIIAQCDAVLSDLKVGAIKTGMLGDAETVSVVVSVLRRYGSIPVVVDPVMVATSGDVLLAADAIGAVRSELIPRAAIITPNLHEAATLLASDVAHNQDEAIRQAKELLDLGCGAVLLKGGHGTGPDAVDVLATCDGIELLTDPRIATRNTHGTGCTLSAAIAAHIADGLVLADAVRQAKSYVWHAIDAARDFQIGRGNGPVDHGFANRRTRPATR